MKKDKLVQGEAPEPRVRMVRVNPERLVTPENVIMEVGGKRMAFASGHDHQVEDSTWRAIKGKADEQGRPYLVEA